MNLKEIAAVINSNKDFIILTHYSADGDALGASFAMSLALQKVGKNVCVILEEDISKLYSFLPSEKISCLQCNIHFEHTEEYTCIAIDSGDISRFGHRKPIFIDAKTTINLDHHYTNEGYADHNFVDSSYSSSGEIIYELIRELNIEIDKDISMCLYVAILTDTGGFKHSSTNSRTHTIVADLLNYDLDTAFISRRVFDKTSISKLNLIKKALESLKFYLDSRVCIFKLTKEDFIEAGASDEETEGLVEIARNIDDVQVAILIKEINEGNYRVNLRSNTDLDVSQVAAVFNGGGHKKAAGCSFSGDYKDNLDKLINEIAKRI